MYKSKLEPYLPPCTKTNSKWIKDLHMKSEILELLKNTDSTLHDTGIGKDVQNRALFVQESKPTDKWNFIKL